MRTTLLAVLCFATVGLFGAAETALADSTGDDGSAPSPVIVIRCDGDTEVTLVPNGPHYVLDLSAYLRCH